MQMIIRAFNLGILLTLFPVLIFAQPTVVGKISFAKGSNAAQQPNTAPRLLGKDAEVYQGDNIQTSDSSFVIVEFIDGSKVTIRPNSNFTIEQFDSASKNAKLTVHEGGVRATTGEFAKSGNNNFQVKTPTATLKGDKDSDFAVNVCKENCNEKKEDSAESVAKVVEVKGDVFAQNREDKNAPERKLAIGSGLKAQDFLTSGANSHLMMVFKDGEKVTLHPNSEFDIVKYDFQKTGKKDQILFKLAAGGMRALTGSIGKKDKSAYALDTPVATIGIRGTDETAGIAFDPSGQPVAELEVHEGAGTMSTSEGSVDVNAGQAAIAKENQPPQIVPPESLSPQFKDNTKNTPAPSNAPDYDNAPKEKSKPQTDVSVKKGNVAVAAPGNDSDKGDDSKDSETETSLSEGENASVSKDSKSSGGVEKTNEDKSGDTTGDEFHSSPSSNSNSSGEQLFNGSDGCGI